MSKRGGENTKGRENIQTTTICQIKKQAVIWDLCLGLDKTKELPAFRFLFLLQTRLVLHLRLGDMTAKSVPDNSEHTKSSSEYTSVKNNVKSFTKVVQSYTEELTRPSHQYPSGAIQGSVGKDQRGDLEDH